MIAHEADDGPRVQLGEKLLRQLPIGEGIDRLAKAPLRRASLSFDSFLELVFAAHDQLHGIGGGDGEEGAAPQIVERCGEHLSQVLPRDEGALVYPGVAKIELRIRVVPANLERRFPAVPRLEPEGQLGAVGKRVQPERDLSHADQVHQVVENSLHAGMERLEPDGLDNPPRRRASFVLEVNGTDVNADCGIPRACRPGNLHFVNVADLQIREYPAHFHPAGRGPLKEVGVGREPHGQGKKHHESSPSHQALLR